MYARLRALYFVGRLTSAGLDRAVAAAWITMTQADRIRAEKAAG
jgi:hypothetical protein